MSVYLKQSEIKPGTLVLGHIYRGSMSGLQREVSGMIVEEPRMIDSFMGSVAVLVFDIGEIHRMNTAYLRAMPKAKVQSEQ